MRRKKHKHCTRVACLLQPGTAANQEWALDFVHVVHGYTRECLALEVDTRFERTASGSQFVWRSRISGHNWDAVLTQLGFKAELARETELGECGRARE